MSGKVLRERDPGANWTTGGTMAKHETKKRREKRGKFLNPKDTGVGGEKSN